MKDKLKYETIKWLATLNSHKKNKQINKISKQWQKIYHEKQKKVINPKNIKILFAPGPLGTHPHILGFESIIAAALNLRENVDVHVLSCNVGLPSCELNIIGNGYKVPYSFAPGFTLNTNQAKCNLCSFNTQKVYNSIGIQCETFPNQDYQEQYRKAYLIVDQVPLNKIQRFQYNGINVGEHAFSSTLRITLKGTIDINDPYDVWVYRRQFTSTLIMVDNLANLMGKIKPDKVVIPHGVYLFHGILAEYANKHKIDLSVYGMPYRKNTILFSHHETYHKALINEPTNYWENLKLTSAMEMKIDEYLQSKTLGGKENVNYHPNPIFDKQAFIDHLKLNQNKPIISLFTNVIWDAQIYYQHNAFENIFDWVFSTISFFEKNENMQLVIRIHPAETKGAIPTKQPLMPEIYKHFPALPKNVFVIPPESDLSSYTLAEMSQAALIYGTKMGVELAIMKIPVIVAGETFNRGKGFTFDIETKEEYFRLLTNLDGLEVADDMQMKAKQFFYYFYYQKMMDFDLIKADIYDGKNHYDDFYNFNSLNSLKEGQNKTLDIILDGILKGTPFYFQESFNA